VAADPAPFDSASFSIFHFPLYISLVLQRLRERLTLLLIALLPLHALLVTVGTKLIEGSGHAPMAVLAVWKEGILGIILVLAVMGLLMNAKRALLCFDAADVLIVALILLSFVVTYLTHQDWKLAALGFKYDFLPLTAFLILRRVPWSGDFLRSARTVLLWIGAAVAAYGLATLVLPRGFFLWLGYGDAHSLYFPDQPLASFQLIAETGIRRIQSTFSGPNQFGLWLLLPLSVLLSLVSQTRERSKEKLSARQSPSARPCASSSTPPGIRGRLVDNAASQQGLPLHPQWRADPPHGWLFPSRVVISLIVLILFALFFSFSRSAWIGGAVMLLVTLHAALPRRIFWRSFAALMLAGVIVAAAGIALSPKVLGRLSSSRGHLTRPLEAVHMIIAHPFGLGLGTAGPASNRVSETCVMLRPQDDPAWAKSQPTLCVFLGDTQVQPADHICRCPFHPENWYLQVGVELGILGFVLFILLMITVLRRLGMQNAKCKMQNDIHSHFSFYISHFTFLAFLAVSIAALFLHAWEDSAIAYTLWMLIASSCPPAFSAPAHGHRFRCPDLPD